MADEVQAPVPAPAWRSQSGTSLPEVHGSILIPHDAPPWRKFLAFAGPGFLVAVGYMDPGNWATDLAGGARFGYALLWVIMMSNLMAILLQHLCIKLGVVTGRDLAQACRDHYPRPMAWFLWMLAELAIAATDLAEVVGSAIGLQLLFGIPAASGAASSPRSTCWSSSTCRTAASAISRRIVLTLVADGRPLLPRRAALLEAGAGAACSAASSRRAGVFKDQAQLYVAIGIIGATVMPHNLYLHSSIVQTRKIERSDRGLAEAVRYAHHRLDRSR